MSSTSPNKQPCRKCGKRPRVKNRSWCRECANELARINQENHQHEPCATCGKKPRMKNQSYCRECKSAYQRAWQKKTYNSERYRNKSLRNRFGITLEEYSTMLEQQNGVCAICGKAETRVHNKTGKVQPLGVDHNHTTGEIRELLCHNCNLLVGNIETNITLVKKALLYLQKHNTI
jgi:hypothetical protein